MKNSRRSVLLVMACGLPALSSLGSTACARGQGADPRLGYHHAASSGLAKTPAPGDRSELEALGLEGYRLYAMERVLKLALGRGLLRAGPTTAAAMVPVALVDDGGRSAEVVFYRWFEDDLLRDGSYDPARARRWLVVPMLLLPDRVLEVEQFNDTVEVGGNNHRKLQAIKIAAEFGEREWPGAHWRLHAQRERSPRGVLGSKVTRVFMFAGDSSRWPDLELVVSDGKRARMGDIVTVNRPHEAGIFTRIPVQLSREFPGAMTVARVLETISVGEVMHVRGRDGTWWRIDGDKGAIRRDTDGARAR